jgi:tetratricopeptide (TPR) repeat protein
MKKPISLAVWGAIALSLVWGHATLSQEETSPPVETPETETTPAEETAETEDFETLAERCRITSGEAGLAFCDRALALNDQDTAVWINRGIKLDRDLGQPNEALAAYVRAAELDPEQDYSLAWFNQCAILLKIATRPNLGNAEILTPILQDLVELPEESTNAADLTSGTTYLYKAVIATCTRAIDGDQDWGNASQARAWNNVGYAQDELGNYGSAIEAYDAALADDPEHLGALNNKAISLENLEQYAEALQVYEQALEIDPNYNLARSNRARLLQLFPELRPAPSELIEPETDAETNESEANESEAEDPIPSE